MRMLVQRVKHASVTIDGRLHSRTGAGLLVFVGVGLEDTSEDAEYLAGKLVRLRIFDDEAGVMNLDVRQTGGEVLVVSQFTLQASTRKGNRPSYVRAAPEAVSRPCTKGLPRGCPNFSDDPSPRGSSAPTCRSNCSTTAR